MTSKQTANHMNAINSTISLIRLNCAVEMSKMECGWLGFNGILSTKERLCHA